MTSTTLDDALDALAPMSPEYAGELSDHAPMVAESLDRLGRLDALPAFLDAWMPKLRPWGSTLEPSIADYAVARDAARARIEGRGVSAAVEAWFDRAGDGVVGAAFHGVIRIAHALVGLERSDSRPRRDELARALGYAEVRAQPISAERFAGEPRPFSDVLRGVVPFASLPRDAPGLISTALMERLAAHPTFRRDAASFALEPDPRLALRGLRASAIDLYLRGDYAPGRTFTLLHVVTGIDACARIVEELDPEGAAGLARAAARALLGMRVAFVGAYPARELIASSATLADLTARAVATLNDHAIKLAATLARATDVADDVRSSALERRVLRVEGPR
ncbi:MAG: hypothetical protein U0414_13310 [Polyangiaceae bacterium]